jgi:hypothetical protein
MLPLVSGLVRPYLIGWSTMEPNRFGGCPDQPIVSASIR